MDEFVEDGASIPSSTIKEQILALLVSNKRSVKVLADVLQIDPVRELVSNYEERRGQVSLDTWKYILQQLGYLEDFLQLVAADQMIADVTDIAGISDLHVGENSSNVQSIPRGCPEWSLPLPDKSMFKENVVEDAAKGDDDQDLSVQAAAGKGPSLDNNTIPSTVQSLSQGNSSTLGLVPVAENGRSQHENSTLAEIEEREENFAAASVDYKQQSIDNLPTTPSRTSTPEAPRSTQDPVVTGQQRSRQNNAAAEAHLPGNGEQDLDYSNEERSNLSKTPAENDYIDENGCTENNYGLYAELQKANESLLLKVSYLVGKLQEKDLVCARLQTKCNSLQQQLEECTGECTQLQISIEELKRLLEESAELETESQRLIRMIQEICILREQENNRLEEHIRQLDQRHGNANRCMDDLRRDNQELSQICILREQENTRLEEHIRQLDQRHDNGNRCMDDLRRDSQELSEELQLAINQMKDLQAERGHNLQREREAARAFNNAETDKVKGLKQKLAREKNKRKTLLEKNHQLEELVRELRSKEEGHFPCGGSCEDDVRENPDSSRSASSEEEDDVQPGSSNYTQQSDSDRSSEGDRLEDVSLDATES